ncbi:MAG: glycoside hydrolase family 127 protein, partial [Armatimonadota bacterium]|nr:glycoside hydrolase family 127 protein [Armatimonadota bacterium]
HYLSALSLAYQATGEAQIKTRINYIVGELAQCQEKNGNGYVSAIPGGKAMFADVAAGKGDGVHRGWVPWYTMHKLFAGLRDAYVDTGNAQAKDVLVKLSDWAVATTANLSDDQWQIMLDQEHGGMNEVLADVYALTGDPKYLALSRKFYQKAVLDPLTQREDKLAGLHGNTQVPKLIGLARLYELTGDPKDRTAASFFWDRVVQTRTYAIGGNTDGEHFDAPGALSHHLSPVTAETCNTYNMLKLTRHLFQWTPTAQYADFYERALYNHILASQDPKRGMMTYYVSLKPGHFKTYSSPTDSFWCCVGTGMENHVKYGDSIYFHDADSLYVNLFIPSVLSWRAKGLTVRQETRFPESDTTHLTLSCAQPVKAALRVRYPSWAHGMTVAVNGHPQAVANKPGSYVSLARTWKTGDRIDIKLPMNLHTEPMPDDPTKVAVLFGPLVLAGQLGSDGLAPPIPYTTGDQGAYFRVPDPPVPVLVTSADKPLTAAIHPVAGQTLTFRTAGLGKPNDVTLKPFYSTYFGRYTVYWDTFTPDAWHAREAAYKAEQERLRELSARTVDEIKMGEQQPEHDHNLQSLNSNTGPYMGPFGETHWRDAGAGGWFSFDLKTLPDAPQDLVCTYWGGETGNRSFDILIDGTKIAAQILHEDKPGQFFDRSYPIPQELLAGKEKVTVRFQPKPGAM